MKQEMPVVKDEKKRFNMPTRDQITGWFGKKDVDMVPYWGIVAATCLYFVGMAFIAYNPSDSTIQEYQYLMTVMSGFVMLGFLYLAIAGFESMRRREMSDTVKIVVAVAISYVAMQTNNWTVIAIAYGFGFSLAHSACRSGDLDFTPMVAFNGAFVGLTAASFPNSNAYVFPVLMVVLFQIIELLRNKNYDSVIMAIPGLLVAIIGLALTTDPVLWVGLGALVSGVIVPTAIRNLYNKLENTDRKKSLGTMLKQCASPCKGWENQFKDVRISFDAALNTLAGSSVVIIVILMYFA